MLSISHLNIGYNFPIVTDINFTLEPGKIVLIYGCNGSGKTTLLKTIVGLIPVLGGDIMLHQHSLNSLSMLERSRIISYCLTHQTAQNLTLYELLNFTWSAINSKPKLNFESILTPLNLSSFINTPISQLSDGQRQKAMIARAIAQDTPFLFLDEPTAFLDFKNKIELTNYLIHLSHHEQKTIIINTHDADWLDHSPDHVFGIHHNKFIPFPKTAKWNDIVIEVYQ